MITTLHDEYQDSRSTGSLVGARRCWLELLASGALSLPLRFTFAFRCPTRRMALGLTDFLRYTDFAGFVRATDPVALASGEEWEVAGTTCATIWSLTALEHLFMRLRGAGGRYESALLTIGFPGE